MTWRTRLLTLTLKCRCSDLAATGVTKILRNGLGLELVSFALLCPHPWVRPLGKDGPGLPAVRLRAGQLDDSSPSLCDPLQPEAAVLPWYLHGGGDVPVSAVSAPGVSPPVWRVPVPVRSFVSIRN